MKNNNKRNAAIVLLVTLFSKALALVRQSVLTYFYGASPTSDAFIVAQSIPNTLFLLVASAIGISFIPVYNKIGFDNKDEQNLFVNHLLQGITIIASLLVAAVLIFTRQIVYLFASGFDQGSIALTCKFVRVSVFSIFFIGWFGVFSALLKANKRFFSATITGVALSIVEIVSCIIAFFNNDIFLAIGITLASFAQFAIVFLSSKKTGFRLSKDFKILDKNVKKVLLLSIPIFVSFGVDEINVIIDKTIASTFGTGSISILTYSSNIIALVNSIFTMSIYTILFTEVSTLLTSNRTDDAFLSIRKALNSLMLILVPATIGLVVFSVPIITIFYERGAFSHRDTLAAASVLSLYAISIIPNGIRMLTQSYYYSIGKTKFCMFVGIGAVLINIIGNIILSRLIGLNGLALSSAMGVVFSCSIHFFYLVKKKKPIVDRESFSYLFRVIISSILMIEIAYPVYNYCSIFGHKISIVISIFIAVVAYGLFSLLFKTLKFQDLRNLFPKVKNNEKINP